MSLSFNDEESFKGAVGSLLFNNPPSDPNTTPQRVELESSSSNCSMPPYERNEDINNPPSDPNSLRRVGSSNSNTAAHQERSEVIDALAT